MELFLLGLAAMALLKKDPKKDKNASKNQRKKESRKRAAERQKYWEDAHWWHLNHGDG